MKASEIREFGVAELKEKIDNSQEELFNLRFQEKMGQLSNPVLQRTVRRDIARCKTILNEKLTEAGNSAE